MADAERIYFDFSGDNGVESVKKLEDILCSGHWSDRYLDFKDEHTLLLIRLLQIGGIEIYKRGYTRKKDIPPETRQRAHEINTFINKRDINHSLLDIADIFSSYEYDGGKTVYNSLFIPELKAFIRCGGLPPDRLFELLEQDGCKLILLFSDYVDDDGDNFYAIILVMPKELFLETLAQTRERITEVVFDALIKANEKLGNIIPSVDWEKDTE